MSACPVPVPLERVKVLILTGQTASPEPLDVVGLYDRDLDTDQCAALHAAYLIGLVNVEFPRWVETLERATGLLARSATTSTRARTAHGHFTSARAAAETITADLADARDALEFRWRSPG